VLSSLWVNLYSPHHGGVCALRRNLALAHPELFVDRRAGLLLFTALFLQVRTQLTTAGMVHATNLTPPGSGFNPSREYGRSHQFMTASMGVRVSNLTPGSGGNNQQPPYHQDALEGLRMCPLVKGCVSLGLALHRRGQRGRRALIRAREQPLDRAVDVILAGHLQRALGLLVREPLRWKMGEGCGWWVKFFSLLFLWMEPEGYE
jgi:hypothetical protein